MKPYYSTDRFFSEAWQLRPYEDVPLPVAVALAEIVTDACRWFSDPKGLFLGDPSAPALPEETVAAVCEALQQQLDKEGKSRTHGSVCTQHGVVHNAWYNLAELPAPRQRALVERVWALRQQSGTSVRTWAPEDEAPSIPSTPDACAGGGWL